MKVKNIKGITLIALVITVIILLILAGVTIATLTGENGILKKATTAKEENNRATAKEKIQLALMSYQIDKEKTTVYDELIKIEGLTYITPDNRNDGPKYNVIVDGYEFVINEDLSIKYVGENKNQIIPEITKVEYETGEVEKLKIAIGAKTEDELGLKEIRVSNKRVENGKTIYETVKVEKVTGKEINVEIEIPINGEYVIEAIGVNNQIGKKEITISNIKQGNILATILPGAINDQAQVTLNIKGEAQGTAIKAMELYVAGQKVQTYEYKDIKTIREEKYTIDSLEFYKQNDCYVKVIDSNNKETSSEVETVINTRIIATTTDLNNLRKQVNDEDNTFEGKTLQLIADIETGENWIPIGYWYGIPNNIDGKYFRGTFEGNKHTITVTSLSKDTTYQSSGIFGMGTGCTINDLTINGTLDAQVTCGGLIGLITNGIICNVTNNSTITDTTAIWHGGIVGIAENSRMVNCNNTGNIHGKSFVGGICGYAYLSSAFSNCTNSGLIKCYGLTITSIAGLGSAEEAVVGGISAGVDHSTIEKSTNTGEITGNEKTILPKGIIAGGIVGKLDAASVYTSKNKGKIHYDVSSGSIGSNGTLGGITGIAGISNIEQCFNEGTVTGKYMDNYGVSLIGGILGYNNTSTIKNTYNIGEIYGEDTVGGIVGYNNVENGYEGKCHLYNSYNASEKIEGLRKVGNFAGFILNGNGAYFSCLSNQLWSGYDDSSSSWGETAVYTLNQMKTQNSGLLTLLLKGDGTVNGNGLWAQEAGKNDGLPYLINNQP